MTAFQQVLRGRDLIPTAHTVLKRDAFAENCQFKPTEDIALGLRRVSDDSVQTARAEAAKYATTMHDDRQDQIEAYNDALMRWTIIAGCCDPNDVTQPAPLFDGSEENVRVALTPTAIRFLWDEIERHHVLTSPVVAVATDEEMAIVAQRILAGPLPVLMTKGAVLRMRKLFGFIRQELIDAMGLEDDLVEAIAVASDVNDEID